MNHKLPNRTEYFQHLHEMLAQRYYIPANMVHFIRNAHLDFGYSKEEIMDALARRVEKKQNYINLFKTQQLADNENLKYEIGQITLQVHSYRRTHSWLSESSAEQWKDLTQLTPYDKAEIANKQNVSKPIS